jgi:ABC-type lipoprotein release transport system permease subunit
VLILSATLLYGKRQIQTASLINKKSPVKVSVSVQNNEIYQKLEKKIKHPKTKGFANFKSLMLLYVKAADGVATRGVNWQPAASQSQFYQHYAGHLRQIEI